MDAKTLQRHLLKKRTIRFLTLVHSHFGHIMIMMLLYLELDNLQSLTNVPETRQILIMFFVSFYLHIVKMHIKWAVKVRKTSLSTVEEFYFCFPYDIHIVKIYTKPRS